MGDKIKIIIIIRTVSFLDDILKLQVINYNSNDNIKKIIILNYDNEKNKNYQNMKEILEKKSKIIYPKDFNYKIKNILNLVTWDDYIYINTDFNILLSKDKINEI